MGKILPSISEWRAIYIAALEFKDIKPWNWMYDSDLFGVQNPENGEIGYCCVMGYRGEFFGLAVYLGTKGLESYLKIQTGKILPDDPDSMYVQDCLVVSFEDRKSLLRDDLKIVKELGLKLRGPIAWPLFRRYKPGYHPWFLNKDEVIYLTMVLQQAKNVCLRSKKGKNFLYPPNEHLFLVRVPYKKGNTVIWKDEYLPPAPLKHEEIIELEFDEIRIQRIKSSFKQEEVIWEVDFFHYPIPILEEGDRPYYPYVFLFVDKESAFVLDAHVAKPFGYKEAFQNRFLNCIEKTGFFPKKIHVKREEAYAILKPIAEILNIEITLVKSLGSLDFARRHIEKYFRM